MDRSISMDTIESEIKSIGDILVANNQVELLVNVVKSSAVLFGKKKFCNEFVSAAYQEQNAAA